MEHTAVDFHYRLSLSTNIWNEERKENAGLRLEWEFEVEVMGLNYLPM